MFTQGFSNQTFNNMNLNYNNFNANKIIETISINNNNDNYEAMISHIDDEKNKNTVEYEIINEPKLDDILKNNTINQLYLGGLSVLGLYVLFQYIKRQPQ